jgi:hypothetical protein
MNRCRNSVVIVGLVAMAVCAVEPNGYFYPEKLHPCTGDSVWVVEEWNFNDPRGESVCLTVLGVTREWTGMQSADFEKYYNEREEFILGVIDLAGLQCGGAGGSTSMPAAVISATFKQTIFTHTAVPREALPKPSKQPTLDQPVPGKVSEMEQELMEFGQSPEEESEEARAVELDVTGKKTGQGSLLPPNHVTTDLEWGIFKNGGASGNGFYLRAGYSRTFAEDKVTLGGILIANTMIMMDKLFFNNALNCYGTFMVSQTASLERKIGGSFNVFMVDEDFAGAPLGMSGVLNFSDNWFIFTDHILTYGLMVQESILADIKTTLVTAGMLYGLPLFERYALNADVIYAINALTMNKNGVITPDNLMMLQPGLSFTIFFSRLFSLDVGAKSTFLISKYNDVILTLGSVILF